MEPAQKIAHLVRQDRRYRFEAYVFVFEALRYAQEQMGLGAEHPSEVHGAEEELGGWSGSVEERQTASRHLTGQELCHAIRRFALEQYGYMAKCVLNQWGVYTTGDFGNIVFNLIEIGEMRKTRDDKREDFDDVFDFDKDLTEAFHINMSLDE